MNQSIQTINISLPKTMLDDLKDLVAAGHFASISEAIRAGINQIKTALHPKYKNIQLGPRALQDFAQAEKDYYAGKTISFDNMDNMMKYLEQEGKTNGNHSISSLSQKKHQARSSKS